MTSVPPPPPPLPTVQTRHASAPVSSSDPVASLELLRLAVERGLPVEALERLQALHERMQSAEAARAFLAALSAFQAACPLLTRGSTAQITTKSGGSYHYHYARLEEITVPIRPVLAAHGLCYTWDRTAQSSGGGLDVICTLMHVGGHSRTASVSVPIASASAMSAQQEIAAAYHVGQRLTLIAVLGLTTAEPDVVSRLHRAPITADQADALRALCEEVGIMPTRVLKLAGVSTVEEIAAADYEPLCQRIRTARRPTGGAA